jgi:hypothetical protein
MNIPAAKARELRNEPPERQWALLCSSRHAL